MAPRPRLANRDARRVFLHRHLLGAAPQGPGKGDDLMQVIRDLGFVQVDSVNTVERAHHMILFARRPAYRPRHLKPLLEKHRLLFEHWTHDAAIIPVDYFPHWRLRFARDGDRLHEKWENWQGAAYRDELDRVLAHVSEHGPVRSGDLAEDRPKGQSGGWWNWHPSKAAMEYLWRSGQLSVCHREGFTKVYDLTANVVPAATLAEHPPRAESIDWLNHGALDRLGFATSGHVAAFWAHVTPQEAATWCRDEEAAGRLERIDVEGADGRTRPHYARPGLIDEAQALPEVTGRLRILSPFDPALRDRNRAEFLFGFYYRIEIFVPEARRQYGYYVFPILEGDRLVGRIDMTARAADGALAVRRIWMEPGLTLSKARLARLEAELARVARFVGVEGVTYAPGWMD
ncbi:winged helix-turn-helix domain-containing protein [Pseudooceanicola sp. LIPI14-2-Ac024]|uniref:winged helix-turn-helix domain-containing protein n=1 Tax=Pseudooceanicola sp. LIPI14-2-Ac024 TaxID=3344875 RepID=UPI0035CEC913